MSVEIGSSAHNFIVSHVAQQFRDLKMDRQEVEQKWMRCIEAYLSHFDKKWAATAFAQNRSARYVAVIFDSVETLLAQANEIIYGYDEWPMTLPMFPGGTDQSDDEAAKVYGSYLRYQVLTGGFKEESDIGMKQLILTGNCPWTMRWVKKETTDFKAYRVALGKWMEKQAQYEQEYGQIMQRYQVIAALAQRTGMTPPPMPDVPPPAKPPVDTNILFEGARPVIGDIFNYVEEPYPNDEMTAFRAHRTWKSREYLKSLARPDENGYRLYENVDSIQNADNRTGAEGNEKEQELMAALGLGNTQMRKSGVELIHAEGTFEIPMGDEIRVFENYLAVIANQRQLIRFEPCPLANGKPTLRNSRLLRLRGFQYGIGLVEMALPENDSVQAIHNQVIDAVHTVIDPQVSEVRDGIYGPYKSGPGQRNLTSEPNMIQPFTYNYSGLQIGAQATEAAISRVERVTGAINVASGGKESATRTARNSNIIQAKIGYWIGKIESGFINEMLQQMHDMNAQYIDKEVMFRVTQTSLTGWQTISPEDIARGWLVYMAGTQYFIDKQERINNGLMFGQMASQPIYVPAVKWSEYLDFMCREIMGRHGTNMINKGPEVEATIQQLALIMAGVIPNPNEQQPQQGGQGGGDGTAQ